MEVVPYNGNTYLDKSDGVTIGLTMLYLIGLMVIIIIAILLNLYPTITTFPDLDPSDGSIVEHIVYTGGDNEPQLRST